jgi:tRNA threonylcarbamoyladenosine modification (KEOPS) complex  Pcc1 subunit
MPESGLRRDLAERLTAADLQTDETVIESALKLLTHNTEMVENRSAMRASSAAIKLSPYVDDITISIATRDLSKLKSSVVSITGIARETGNKTIQSIVEALDQQLAKPEPEYEQLSQLAERIMDLCRSTRHSLVKGLHHRNRVFTTDSYHLTE